MKRGIFVKKFVGYDLDGKEIPCLPGHHLYHFLSFEKGKEITVIKEDNDTILFCNIPFSEVETEKDIKGLSYSCIDKSYIEIF